MAKNKGGRGMKLFCWILIAALAIVILLILWKQREYAAGDDFYGGLRGAMWLGGAII